VKWIAISCAAIVVLMAGTGVVAARETYGAFVARMAEAPPAGETYRPDLEATLLTAANDYRAGRGLPPLKNDPSLLAAARAHAADMAAGDFVGHRASTGQDFEGRMHALFPGQMMLPMMGENAARDRSHGPADGAKALRLFQQWVKSPPHARTLRARDFVAVATGVVERNGVLYASQIFVGGALHTNMFGGGVVTPSSLY
jgi:uncharacterized protein YkwD